MLSVVPIEEPEEPTGKSWPALALSTALHALVILWLLFRPTTAETLPPPPGANEPAPQPIALPPEQPKADQRQLSAVPPPPPAPQAAPPKETPLGPDSKNPDALVPKEAGPEKPLTEPDPTPETAKSEEAAPPKTEATPPDPQPSAPSEQSARRIPRASDYGKSLALGRTPTSPWGPTQPDALDPAKAPAKAPSGAPAVTEGAMGRVGLGAHDNRNWRPSFPEAAGKCVPIPDLGKNADGTPVLATVIGRVVDTDGRTPLAGAHLQIVGTTFTTFSDNNGEYRLEFDPKLLEACRVQYVRVLAPGYSSQLLTLSIGQRIRSDDVILRRN